MENTISAVVVDDERFIVISDDDDDEDDDDDNRDDGFKEEFVLLNPLKMFKGEVRLYVAPG